MDELTFAEIRLHWIPGDVAAIGPEFFEIADDAVIGLGLPK